MRRRYLFLVAVAAVVLVAAGTLRWVRAHSFDAQVGAAPLVDRPPRTADGPRLHISAADDLARKGRRACAAHDWETCATTLRAAFQLDPALEDDFDLRLTWQGAETAWLETAH